MLTRTRVLIGSGEPSEPPANTRVRLSPTGKNAPGHMRPIYICMPDNGSDLSLSIPAEPSM